MKKFIIPSLMMTIGIALITYGVVTCLPPKKQPVYVEYFKDGQILLPDYVCTDTLIVLDAKGLNKGMAFIEQGFIEATDDQIDSILHSHTKIK